MKERGCGSHLIFGEQFGIVLRAAYWLNSYFLGLPWTGFVRAVLTGLPPEPLRD